MWACHTFLAVTILEFPISGAIAHHRAGRMGAFGTLFVCTAAAVYFAPQYTLLGSRTGTVAATLVSLALLKALYLLVLYPWLLTPLKHIHTPAHRSWLTGNLTSFLIETPYELLGRCVKHMPNEGLLRFYIVGNLEWIFVTSPQALREMLASKVYAFEKPELLRCRLQNAVGDGLILAEGEEHKIQRKSLLPAFSYRHVKNLYPVFWSKSVEMVKMIEKEVESRGDGTIQVSTWASRATLHIIGVAALGHDFEALKSPNNALHRAYQRLTAETLGDKILFLLVLLFFNPKYTSNLPASRNREMKDSSAFIRNIARQLIQQKKAARDGAVDTSIDILSVAMQSGILSEENLVEQAMTFLSAGHDTTSVALQWSIYALCQYQHVEHRLREEVRHCLPATSAAELEPLAASTLDSLPYLNAVVNEVLRFYPSIAKTVRVAVRDTSLVGKHIPKGTCFLIAPQIINRIDELWGEKADQFDPGRFMGPGRAQMGGATSNFANMAFLQGPRSCIGQEFAKASFACLLAVTVGRFHMELKDPDAQLRLHEGSTLAPADGVVAKLTRLDGW